MMSVTVSSYALLTTTVPKRVIFFHTSFLLSFSLSFPLSTKSAGVIRAFAFQMKPERDIKGMHDIE